MLGMAVRAQHFAERDFTQDPRAAPSLANAVGDRHLLHTRIWMMKLQTRGMVLTATPADQLLLELCIPARDHALPYLTLLTPQIGRAALRPRVPRTHGGSPLLGILRRHGFTLRGRSETRTADVSSETTTAPVRGPRRCREPRRSYGAGASAGFSADGVLPPAHEK